MEIAPETPADRAAIHRVNALAFGRPHEADLVDSLRQAVRCRRQGEMVVFVLGHAAFYLRFGFLPAAPRGLRCEFAVAEDVFMVAELAAGALRGRQGLVRYHPLFHTV